MGRDWVPLGHMGKLRLPQGVTDEETDFAHAKCTAPSTRWTDGQIQPVRSRWSPVLVSASLPGFHWLSWSAWANGSRWRTPHCHPQTRLSSAHSWSASPRLCSQQGVIIKHFETIHHSGKCMFFFLFVHYAEGGNPGFPYWVDCFTWLSFKLD